MLQNKRKIPRNWTNDKVWEDDKQNQDEYNFIYFTYDIADDRQYMRVGECVYLVRIDFY